MLVLPDAGVGKWQTRHAQQSTRCAGETVLKPETLLSLFHSLCPARDRSAAYLLFPQLKEDSAYVSVKNRAIKVTTNVGGIYSKFWPFQWSFLASFSFFFSFVPFPLLSEYNVSQCLHASRQRQTDIGFEISDFCFQSWEDTTLFFTAFLYYIHFCEIRLITLELSLLSSVLLTTLITVQKLLLQYFITLAF